MLLPTTRLTKGSSHSLSLVNDGGTLTEVLIFWKMEHHLKLLCLRRLSEVHEISYCAAISDIPLFKDKKQHLKETRKIENSGLLNDGAKV